MLHRCAQVGEQEISLDSSYLLQAENGTAQCSWTTGYLSPILANSSNA